MIVYKVTDEEGGKHYSWAAGGMARIEYIVGVPVIAPDWLAERGYHIVAFSNLEDAQKYITWERSNLLGERFPFGLWEAEAEDLVATPPICYLSKLFDGCLEVCEMLDEWFKGTIMVKKLTLLRRVE